MAAGRTPCDGNEIGVTAEPLSVGPSPRNRSFDVRHLARPAVSRARPVLNGQAHPPSPRQVGHQRVALQRSTTEHPGSAR